MISDDISKAEFVVKVLDRDALNIYKAQKLIAEHSIYIKGKDLKSYKKRNASPLKRTGRLIKSLNDADYSIKMQGGQFIVSSEIALHTRFLDMKKFGNHRIYNAQVWGILYRTTLPTIKYQYGKRVHDVIGERLRQALEEQK